MSKTKFRMIVVLKYGDQPCKHIYDLFYPTGQFRCRKYYLLSTIFENPVELAVHLSKSREVKSYDLREPCLKLFSDEELDEIIEILFQNSIIMLPLEYSEKLKRKLPGTTLRSFCLVSNATEIR